MKFQKSDNIFFAICFILLSGSLYGLYIDYTGVLQRNTTNQIGTITFKKKVAERKFTAQTLWGSLQNNSPIYNYDTIRTADEALALVKLNDGSEVDLGDNTLVVLSLDDKFASVDVNSGNVSARGGGKSGLRLISDKVQAMLQNGEVNFFKDENGDLSVSGDSLDLSLLSEGEQIDIGGGDKILQVGTDGKPKIIETVYSLQAPKNSTSFVTGRRSKSIKFSWTSNDSVKKTILLSKNPNFRKIVYRFSSEKNAVTGNVAEGTYYWKVVSSKGESSYRKLQVLQDDAPVALLPETGSQFNYVASAPMVRFAWSGSKLSSVYNIQVFKDAKMKESVATMSSRSTTVSLDSLTEGVYYWRVKSVYPDNFQTEGVTSGLQKFTVKKIETLAPPKILQAESEAVVTQKMLDAETPAFHWQDDPNAESYKVEVAKDREFTDIVSTTETKYNFAAPSADLEEGKYFWRVTAVTKEKSSKQSRTKTLVVKAVGDIKNVLPQDNASFFPHEIVHFAWTDENKSGHYILVLSTSPSFTEIERAIEVHVNRTAIDKRLRAGKYYWKVTSVDEEGKPEVEGPISAFAIKGTSGTLELLSPADKTTIDFSYANGIKFSWKGLADAQFYRIKIFDTTKSGKENVVYNKVVTSNSFQTNDLQRYREKTYTWEVTALLKDQKTNDYLTISKPTQRNFTITLSQKIKIPKLDAPKGLTIYEK